jgi:hypothetical protein
MDGEKLEKVDEERDIGVTIKKSETFSPLCEGVREGADSARTNNPVFSLQGQTYICKVICHLC